MQISDDLLRSLWAPKIHYLDTASYGLPPQPTLDAVKGSLDEWRDGIGSWEKWSEATHEARSAFARLVKVDPAQVATGASVSQLVGYIAASLPQGSRILVPEGDFTSLIWPFLVHRDRGVDVVAAPFAELAGHIDEGVSVVALSIVQSATGEIAAVDDIIARAHAYGAQVLADATQACGWLPVDARIFDYLVCAGYKWLMTPRGTAFLVVREDRTDDLRPLGAGWFAAEDIHGSYYGHSIALAEESRRLDLSPAWFSWVGATASLQLILDIGVEDILEHNLGLVRGFMAAIGREANESAIVSVRVPDIEARLRGRSVKVSLREGRLRASFHIYNSEADVQALIDALT
jgi:selenocysteine lyase/cysteine desulfurase